MGGSDLGTFTEGQAEASTGRELHRRVGTHHLWELPAVASLKLSYAELEKDSTQVDYLTWVIRHESGMAEDLAKFLKAVNFDQKHDLGSLPVPLFPARASFASSSGF